MSEANNGNYDQGESRRDVKVPALELRDAVIAKLDHAIHTDQQREQSTGRSYLQLQGKQVGEPLYTIAKLPQEKRGVVVVAQYPANSREVARTHDFDIEEQTGIQDGEVFVASREYDVYIDPDSGDVDAVREYVWLSPAQEDTNSENSDWVSSEKIIPAESPELLGLAIKIGALPVKNEQLPPLESPA